MQEDDEEGKETKANAEPRKQKKVNYASIQSKKQEMKREVNSILT
jgi:hypothetical protein